MANKPESARKTSFVAPKGWTLPVPPDVRSAILRELGDWDGTNLQAVFFRLRNRGYAPEEIGAMDWFAVRMAFATVTVATTAYTNNPTVVSLDLGTNTTAPDLPPGDWLMPPITLRNLASRIGGELSDEKLHALLDQYGLRNYPADNRQSWTVNLSAPMPSALRQKLEKPPATKNK